MVGRTDPVILTLDSPVNPEVSIEFTLDGTNDEHVRMELIETMLIAFEFFPEVKAVLDREYPELHKATSITSLRDAMATFNKAAKTVTQPWKGTTPMSHCADQPIEGPLFKRIWTLVYNRSITDPRSLNKHYSAFSSETYGETSYDRMQKIIGHLKPSKKDVFVDLGSGIGQLVIHMAGASAVRKSVGIEIADLPFKYAKQLETEFKSPRLEELIKRELLSELKDGTTIITTKSYARRDRASITERNVNDISAILDVSVLEPCTNAVSWTSNYVPYFLHVVNRSKQELYYQRRAQSMAPSSTSGLKNIGVLGMPSSSRIQRSQSAHTLNTPHRAPRKTKTPTNGHPERKTVVRPVRKQKTSNEYHVNSDSTRSSSMEQPPVLTRMSLDLDPTHHQHFIHKSSSLSGTEYVEPRLVVDAIQEELANMQRLQRLVHDLHAECTDLALKNYIMSQQRKQLSGHGSFE
ncbi:hypothetical protein QR680_002597 [Steinernema hermaphroditum]|uniref:Histone-lysine N-methyltransferase, H3 lysine-79 specific n=1 Tax=Steinernema hermaphroditum TaxID=289476 RepID=A0AA39H3B3_9BILA|nr:hypothetical protein QR680_002597 [Steinernema hermaphroditum]